ncbi:VWA domain-containing protein [Micromonospora sp. FIMYZ51]|uniref:VWA domain-containing protein n=1 Tax=Micromonospora sp. FIMYZ51 TaxID=3051832 RepID=UPI00311E25F1
MSSTGKQGGPGVLVVLWPCDEFTDDPRRDGASRGNRDFADAQGWQIVGEVTVPVCPHPRGHHEHRAVATATSHRIRELMRDRDRTLLFSPSEVLPAYEWLTVLRDLPGDPGEQADDLWRAFLLDLLSESRIEILGSGGSWQLPLLERMLRRDDAMLPAFPRDAGMPLDDADLPLDAASRPDDDDDDLWEAAAESVHLYARRRATASELGYRHPREHGRSAGVRANSSMRNEPPTMLRTGPLPHDGLFIRRNNAFGTRPALGIADLIDQGVLIDQTRIRFDDFIASDTDRIPVPEPGSAIAVSHGSTAVPSSFTAYEQTTHLVEIALRAGASAPSGQPTGTPLSVNFVFAVDVSYSMTGEKLDDAIVAIRELYAQLRESDVLGIIVFNEQARTLLRATRKADLSDDRLGQLLAGLCAAGGTDLNLGLSFAFDEIERHSAAGTVNRVYLFSDGDPTSGETNWITIRANVAARMRGDVTLSCFGFGSDARVPELRALAGVSGGHWSFVTKATDVTSTLSEELARRDGLAAINIQLRIDIPPETTVWHIYGHDLVTDPAGRAAVHAEAAAARQRSRDEYRVENLPDLIRDEHGIRIFAPDLAYGETYWVVLELQLPDPASAGALGRATVQYLDTLARDNRRVEVELATAGELPAETVLTHGIGLRTSEVTFYALDDLYEDDKESATRRLKQHVQTLRAAQSAVPSAQLRADSVTLGKLVSLASNLGTRQASFEGAGAPVGVFAYAVHTLNQFGRARGGHLTARGFATR